MRLYPRMTWTGDPIWSLAAFIFLEGILKETKVWPLKNIVGENVYLDAAEASLSGHEVSCYASSHWKIYQIAINFQVISTTEIKITPTLKSTGSDAPNDTHIENAPGPPEFTWTILEELGPYKLANLYGSWDFSTFVVGYITIARASRSWTVTVDITKSHQFKPPFGILGRRFVTVRRHMTVQNEEVKEYLSGRKYYGRARSVTTYTVTITPHEDLAPFFEGIPLSQTFTEILEDYEEYKICEEYWSLDASPFDPPSGVVCRGSREIWPVYHQVVENHLAHVDIYIFDFTSRSFIRELYYFEKDYRFEQTLSPQGDFVQFESGDKFGKTTIITELFVNGELVWRGDRTASGHVTGLDVHIELYDGQVLKQKRRGMEMVSFVLGTGYRPLDPSGVKARLPYTCGIKYGGGWTLYESLPDPPEEHAPAGPLCSPVALVR